MEEHVSAYVAREPKKPLPPPPTEVGVLGILRKNLFATPLDSIVTVVLGLFSVWAAWRIFDWSVVSAVFIGSDREACLAGDGGPVGACWAFIRAKLGLFTYGIYPVDERWRVDLTILLLVALAIPFATPRIPFKGLNAFLLGAFPFIALVLLTGGHFRISGGWVAFLFILAAFVSTVLAAGNLDASPARLRAATWFSGIALLVLIVSNILPSGSLRLLVFSFSTLSFVSFLLAVASIAVSAFASVSTSGKYKSVLAWVLIPPLCAAALLVLLAGNFGLQPVPTNRWGGLLVTLVVALTGIGVSLPLGILLALGRRSHLPAIRLLSIIFIEFWRGVPLITVLFMSAFMIPLLLPSGVSFNQLLRALIGVALFSSAYMAEVVRGGLQAVPKGQYEGAQALGLGYWQMMRLVIMPQAIKLVIPGIVNTFIGLFKDTSLVYIIGLADLLGAVRRGFSDPNWITPTTAATGLVFAAFIYWLFCFGMSRYSIFMERRLETGHKN